MSSKQLDFTTSLVGIPTSELNEQASDVWNLIQEHNPKTACVFHYYNGDVHISIMPSAEELIHFAFSCKSNQLLDLIAKTAQASEVEGKMHLSHTDEYRKVNFDFR